MTYQISQTCLNPNLLVCTPINPQTVRTCEKLLLNHNVVKVCVGLLTRIHIALKESICKANEIMMRYSRISEMQYHYKLTDLVEILKYFWTRQKIL